MYQASRHYISGYRLSEWCFWRFMSSGSVRRVLWWRATFLLRLRDPEDEGTTGRGKAGKYLLAGAA